MKISERRIFKRTGKHDLTAPSTMNHLRVNKFRLVSGKDSAADLPQPDNANTNNNNNNNNTNNNNGGAKGFLGRIKRYSVLGRRHLGSMNLHTGRDNHQQQHPHHHPGSGDHLVSPGKLHHGSYNMTGSHSEDHRLEIGAPVLISTTTLDTDRFDVTEARLKQIGGGIAQTSSVIRTLTPKSSDEDEFVDARGTPQQYERMDRDHEEQQPEKDGINLEDVKPLEDLGEKGKSDIAGSLDEELEEEQDQFQTPKHHPADPYPDPEPEVTVEEANTPITPPKTPDESNNEVEPPIRRPRIARQQMQSQSVQNLHRSELSIYLHKTHSMALDMNVTAPAKLGNLDLNLPELPELYGASELSLAASDNNKENNEPVVKSSQEIIRTPIPNGGFAAQQANFKSLDSLYFNSKLSQRSSQQSSHRSLASSSNAGDLDFDLKSISYQSLNAQNLFVSIDELQELSRQINESEDFSREIDLEYCTHRDQLRPSERRITLLKNKNQTLINFSHNKEKLRKGWHGMKNWLGEESFKIKEVVRQQTPLKRLAQSRNNLNQSEANAKSMSPERSRRDMTESCEDVTEMESSMSNRNSEEDLSPHAKRFKDEGQNGFEELRRYVKQGGDFSKELIFVLQERADSELIYSKSLSKLANKLNKAGREIPGSVADAWRGVATEMESRSDIHRQLAASLTDELVKPLKTVVEGHHKARKSVESNVDKAARVLGEWRASEAKAKKASHTAARENEKLQDAMLDVRIQKSPSIALLHQGPNKQAAEKELKSAEKDCVKLDNKRKKAEEAVKRADVEYYTLCVRAERARVDWEMAVLRGSAQLQSSEQQRLGNMHNFAQQYARLIADMNPILGGLSARLQPQLEACNVSKDMQVVRHIRRNSEGPSEQLLPDFYCEHTTLAMNRERRKHALVKLLQLVKTDLERERRSRDGLRGLSQSLNHQEHQNITDKLYHIRSMLTYLEGARLKLHSALLELDHKPRTTHPLAQHIQITRDRTGLQQSILKVPNWLKNNDKSQQQQHQQSALDITDTAATAAGHEDELPDDHCSHLHGSHTNSNGSCTDISSVVKPFNRSKSNIETNFTSQPKIISTTNAAVAAMSVKAKTLANNHNHHQHHHHHQHSDRGQADGGSNQQDSDFDEFSSQDEEDEEQQPVMPMPNKTPNPLQTQHFYQNAQDLQNSQKEDEDQGVVGPILGRCKALYSYTPKLYDELELSPGDIIEVHAKQDDGWWLGALRNHIGIFPATYVEECA
ncbi:myosin-2 heavy chain isoform X1 [Drosophila kikkawai]|uniref:Myosin-2 heavy chain isoform X1 n=2 Tax=Drosophila kikkawai TaxID=30033 RepID=A0ABM4GPB7_DROKI